jgi:hypothetical protein
MIGDNAGNIKRSSEILGIHFLPCFLHTLNLFICDNIYNSHLVKPLVVTLTNIISHFKRSKKDLQELFKKQIDANEKDKKRNLKPLAILTHCPTIWNSLFYAMMRVLQLYDFIKDIISDPMKLSQNDLLKLCYVNQILEFFDNLIILFSNENSNFSHVYQMIITIMDNLKAISVSDQIKQFSDELLNAIEINIPIRFDEYLRNEIIINSIILNPKYKLALIENPISNEDSIKEDFTTVNSR